MESRVGDKFTTKKRARAAACLCLDGHYVAAAIIAVLSKPSRTISEKLRVSVVRHMLWSSYHGVTIEKLAWFRRWVSWSYEVKTNSYNSRLGDGNAWA